MTNGPVFFDLDDTLLDDTGAQDAYLAELFVAWRTDLPHDVAAFCAAWRTALDRHFERHLRGELTFLEQRRERIRGPAVGRDYQRLELQQRSKLQRTGIADRFVVLVTSDGTRLSKPDPRTFHHAAAAAAMRPPPVRPGARTPGLLLRFARH